MPTRSAPLDEVLEHAEWLRRLAACLGRDADADDAVQETWIAAWQSPPALGVSPRPWLFTVLRNFVRRHARTDARRAEREAAALPTVPEAVDTGEALERLELQRILAELVEALEEPYRTTILLRFFEGRTSAEIARTTGVPEGTVRWRLKEALAKLRARLDERYGERPRSWRVVVMGLGAGSARVGGHEETAAPPAGLARISGRGPGGSFVPFAVFVSGALLVAVFWGWRSSARTETAMRGPGITARAPTLSAAASTRGEAGDAAGVVGVVHGPDGQGIAGAIVTAYRPPRVLGGLTPLELCRPLAFVRSGPAGDFRITGLAPGPVVLTGTAQVLTPARAEIVVPQAEGAGIVLALGPEGLPLRGRVEDAGGGPIAGATVAAWTPGKPGLALAITDAKGEYGLGLEREKFFLLASAPGYVAEAGDLVMVAERAFGVRLFPGGRITGRVVEASTGAPVAGASVVVDVGPRSRGEEARTDEQGTFVLDGLLPGRFQLQARRGRLRGMQRQVITVAGAGTVDRGTIEVSPAAAVSGRITDVGGCPVSGAEIRVNAAVEMSGTAVEGHVNATSGSDGRYQVQGLLPGRYHVGVRARPYTKATASFEIGTTDRTDVDVVLEPGARVTVHVVSAAGVPVPGALVSVAVRDRQGELPHDIGGDGGRADASGQFVGTGLPAGFLSVSARHLDHGTAEAARVPLAAGESRTIEVQFGAPAFISGSVRYDDGTGVVGAAVTWQGAETVTDQRGHYRLGPVGPGRGEVRATAPDAAPGLQSWPWTAARPDVQVEAGREVKSIDLELPRTRGALEGVVLDADGRPVVDATVSLAPTAAKPGQGAPFSRTMTGLDGRFSFHHVPDGPLEVRAKHAAYAPQTRAGVRAGTSGIALQLAPGAQIVGEVTAESAPLSGVARILLFTSDGADETEVGEQRVPASDGSFEFSGLSAGRYGLYVRTADDRLGRLDDIVVAEGQRREGVVLVARPGVTVAGRVLAGDSGAPLAKARVYLIGPRFGSIRPGNHYTHTDASGAFLLHGIWPGSRVGFVADADSPYGQDGRRVDIPAGRTRIDLAPFLLPRKSHHGASR